MESRDGSLRKSEASIQGAPECLTPRSKLARQVAPTHLQQLILKLQFPLPPPAVDRADAFELLAAEAFQSLPIQIFEIRNLADGCFNRIASALAALHDPFQHAHVFAVSRPDEFSIRIGAKPIDAENAGTPGHRAAQLEPVAE